MKKITFLLLGLLMTTSASATEYEYVPLVREGVVWEYVLYNNSIGFNPNYEVLYYLEFKGSSVLDEYDGTTDEYYNLYRTDCDFADSTEPFLVGYLKEKDKIVTARMIDFDDFPKEIYGAFYNWTPQIVYDFNKPLFMSIDNPDFVDFFDNYTFDEFEVTIGNSKRNGYHLLGTTSILSGQEINIIEGVGIDCIYGDLLVPYRDFLTSAKSSMIKSKIDDIAELTGDTMAGLSAVYENGELVYKGCLYEEAQQLKELNAVTAVAGDKRVQSLRYYNLAGVESAEPRQGVNIKVTTYSDGTRQSEKVVIH